MRLKKFISNFSNKLLLNPNINVLLIWFTVIFISLVPLAIDVPESYFSNKYNIFNQLFVKKAWMWNLISIGPYMILTSYVYGVDHWKSSLIRSILRLLCGTVIWYFWAQVIFPAVDHWTGVCKLKTGVPDFTCTTKSNCKTLNGFWSSLDISGHCFLLSFIILFVSSELQIHKHWNKIPSKASLVFPLGSKSLTTVKKRFIATEQVIYVFYVFNCLLLALWYTMMLVTCLYFHDYIDKPLGAGIAITSWMAIYKEWYKSKISPGMPGKGHLFNLLSTVSKKQ